MADSNLLYTRADLSVETLLSEIDSGATGLPKMQRKFVWKDTKVRDLLDSMIKGYPVGFIITWEAPGSTTSHPIGTEHHAYPTQNKLIIDGQQRLTSLYSVFRGKEIEDADFHKRRILISFNPLTKTFEVATPALEKSPEWIYSISDVFLRDSQYQTTKEFIEKLTDSREKSGSKLTDEEIKTISDNIVALFDLRKYLLPTLVISANADEEDVSHIFVMINSGGTKLTEADFILTLISVHWDQGRDLIEEFCADTKKHNSEGGKDICNPIIDFDPGDVVRTVMAFGFHRARLKYAYKLLHGADFDKRGAISEELREKRFAIFEEKLRQTIDRDEFNEFLKCIVAAGYCDRSLIGSKTNIIFAYAFYLIGKYEYKLNGSQLRKIISKAIFFFSLTSRYVGSFESQMEQDMLNLPEEKTPETFQNYFDNMAKSVLTDDFFNVTLIGMDGLETSSSRSPAFLAYIASQNILQAHVLLSKPSLQTATLYAEWAQGRRKSVECHHLFPKAYLRTLGLRQKEINQVANYAFIEWTTNLDISDTAPNIYFSQMTKDMDSEAIAKMEEENALPSGWENMNYNDFLSLRRQKMAETIKAGINFLNH